jgi:hypothetical protein
MTGWDLLLVCVAAVLVAFLLVAFAEVIAGGVVDRAVSDALDRDFNDHADEALLLANDAPDPAWVAALRERVVDEVAARRGARSGGEQR